MINTEFKREHCVLTEFRSEGSSQWSDYDSIRATHTLSGLYVEVTAKCKRDKHGLSAAATCALEERVGNEYAGTRVGWWDYKTNTYLKEPVLGSLVRTYFEPLSLSDIGPAMLSNVGRLFGTFNSQEGPMAVIVPDEQLLYPSDFTFVSMSRLRPVDFDPSHSVTEVRTMTTAPKDGTTIVLYFAIEGEAPYELQAYWHESLHVWMDRLHRPVYNVVGKEPFAWGPL